MLEETTVYQVRKDEEVNKPKFAESTIRAVAERSWWRKTPKKTIAKKSHLTEEEVDKLRLTSEYREYVEQIMFERYSSEDFEKWIARHKRDDQRHGRDEMQELAEHMGIDRSVVLDMVERVRQAHRNIALGKMKASPQIPSIRRKQVKKQKHPIVIDKTLSSSTIPGMLLSAKSLIILDDNEFKAGQYAYGSGYKISIAMIVCHSAELLLKYKIQSEGKVVKKGHNLSKYFNMLEAKSISEIEEIFKNETPQDLLRPGLTNVESIFMDNQDAFLEWRYELVTHEGPRDPNRIVGICPGLLYNATLSVYKSTDIYPIGPDIFSLGSHLHSRRFSFGSKLP